MTSVTGDQGLRTARANEAERGPSLLDHMDRAASGKATIHLVRTGEHFGWAELWAEAHRCAGWLDQVLPQDQVLAGLLEPTRQCLVTLLGACVAGRTFASLPHPSRSMGVDEYRAQIVSLVELVDATAVVIPAELSGAAGGAVAGVLPSVREMSYPEIGRSRAVSGGDGGRLVQFTSGSTDRPRGVVVDVHRLGANAEAMASSVAVGPGDVFFSWLPLSHDMGLVGMFLAPAAALSPDLGGASQIWLSDPVRFVRDPLSWLRLAGDIQGTITAAPNFALELVTRRLERHHPGHAALALSSLRCLIVGSETVDAGTLRRFVAATAGFGLREAALCPAYGLAEATLAVTITRPGTGWTNHPGSVGSRGEGEGVAPSMAGAQPAQRGCRREPVAGTELVCLGPPIPAMQVRAGSSVAEPAEIEVRGPSVAGELLGRPGSFTTDGWLLTGDLGFLHDGQLYFTARTGDRLVVRGRNLDAGALQRRLGAVAGVRPGCCAVVSDGLNGYAVALEAAASNPSDPLGLCRSVADAATRWAGASPERVIVVGRGTLPKTPSGKPQPHRLRAGLAEGTILPIIELAGSGRRVGSA